MPNSVRVTLLWTSTAIVSYLLITFFIGVLGAAAHFGDAGRGGGREVSCYSVKYILAERGSKPLDVLNWHRPGIPGKALDRKQGHVKMA